MAKVSKNNTRNKHTDDNLKLSPGKKKNAVKTAEPVEKKPPARMKKAEKSVSDTSRKKVSARKNQPDVMKKQSAAVIIIPIRYFITLTIRF